MGLDLCQSWLKVKHRKCMVWELGKTNRALDGMLLIWSKNCCNLCNDESSLWFATTVQTNVVSSDERCRPLLPEIHVTTTG